MRSTARRSRIFSVGDIVRVPFPHVERDRAQARPALVITAPVGPDGLLTWTLMITAAKRGRWPGDIAIGDDHEALGLPVRCVVRTAKIAAIETNRIESKVGRLPDGLLAEVHAALADLLALHPVSSR